jgi:hypothetical protein
VTVLVAAGLLHSVFGQRDVYQRHFLEYAQGLQVHENFKVQRRFFLHLSFFYIRKCSRVVLNLKLYDIVLVLLN